MKKYVFSVEGMACGMCEAHVNDAVRAAVPVKSVKSDHGKCVTEIVTEEDIEPEKVIKAISGAGYTVGSFNVSDYKKKGLFSRG